MTKLVGHSSSSWVFSRAAATRSLSANYIQNNIIIYRGRYITKFKKELTESPSKLNQDLLCYNKKWYFL